MPEDYFAQSSGESPPPFAGLEFIELATRSPQATAEFLEALGFVAIAHHRSKAVTLFRQGEINLVVNASENSFASAYADSLGASVCALALRTGNASSTYQSLLARGAWEAATSAGAMELNIPAIESIGGSQIYLVDRYGDGINIYDIDFKPLKDAPNDAGILERVASVGLSMSPERIQPWTDYYTQLFGFTPTHENRLTLDRSLELTLETNPESDLQDEQISSLVFTVADLERARERLSERGIRLSPAGAGQPKYRIEAPLENLAVTLFISADPA
nr:VOC family protein [Marinobacterium litorale]